MRKLALITVALLASTALAAAQAPTGGNKTEGAAPAPSAQQKAPAEKMQQKAPAEKMAPRARNGAKETTGQAPKAGADTKASTDTKAGAQTNSETPKANADTKAGANGKAGADMKAQKDDKAGAAGKNGNRNAQRNMNDNDKNKAAAQDKANDKNGKASAQTERKGKETTTGQGAAGARGAANLSTEQRTKIRTVIREKTKVKPVTNVNFSVSVGTVVPRTIHYYPLPAEVVTIYPAWSGFYFILVGTQIVVIEPSSYKIVAVLA